MSISLLNAAIAAALIFASENGAARTGAAVETSRYEEQGVSQQSCRARPVRKAPAPRWKRSCVQQRSGDDMVRAQPAIARTDLQAAP